MNVEPPETLVIIESIVYKSNGFAICNKKIECISLAVVSTSRGWEYQPVPPKLYNPAKSTSA
jgi:hypothetical protein